MTRMEQASGLHAVPAGDEPGPARLLVTKLKPPPVREQTVTRERLLARLQCGSAANVTLLAAPAGYGKTTLLATWTELEQPVRPVAWLSLDAGDDDPVRFWSYVLAALRRVNPSLAHSTTPEQVGAAHLLDRFLPELVNGLAELEGGALVLDDFHRLSAGPARAGVAWLVDNAPATFQLVLSTRSEPALPLPALRAHGALLELRAVDLGFTSAEAELLLNDRLGLAIDRALIGDLVARSEGWPAGLYLAALSLQGIEDRNGFVERFGGRSRHVVDFLVDEVLDAHDRPLQELMLRSSILDGLSGRLCDAVLEREGSAQLLESLARTNLFLVPLDDRGEWFRFHHLFAQLLRAELEHREPGLAPALHRRAHDWHRDHGSPEAAVDHALEAGMYEQAAAQIAADWPRQVDAGGHATVLAWLDRLPPELVRRRAPLLAVRAWMLFVAGRATEADELVELIETRADVDAGPLADGFGSMAASLAALRARMPFGDAARALASARRAADLEGAASPWRPVVCWALGEAEYLAGDLVEAERRLHESVVSAQCGETYPFVASALALRSLIAGERGCSGEQQLFAERALEAARSRGGVRELEGNVLVAVGMALTARGRVDEALPRLEEGLTLLRRQGQQLDLALALLRLASVLAPSGDREGAGAARAEAETIVQGCPNPGRLLRERLAASRPVPRARTRKRDTGLSERERVVLRLLAGTLTERDIGRQLYLSQNTVHSHVSSIYRKLGVSSRADAVERARALGVLRGRST